MTTAIIIVFILMIGLSLWELYSMVKRDDPELNHFFDED